MNVTKKNVTTKNKGKKKTQFTPKPVATDKDAIKASPETKKGNANNNKHLTNGRMVVFNGVAFYNYEEKKEWKCVWWEKKKKKRNCWLKAILFVAICDIIKCNRDDSLHGQSLANDSFYKLWIAHWTYHWNLNGVKINGKAKKNTLNYSLHAKNRIRSTSVPIEMPNIWLHRFKCSGFSCTRWKYWIQLSIARNVVRLKFNASNCRKINWIVKC